MAEQTEPAGRDSSPNAKVFISYSRTDHVFAEWLRDALAARGIEAFRDLDDTLPGEDRRHTPIARHGHP